jgi:phosphopantothenoylcysteine decarboxylase
LVEIDMLAEVSGHPLRVEPRKPQDPDPLLPADAVIAAPLTFNSLNKWAASISDTLTLDLLNASWCTNSVCRRTCAMPRPAK